MAQLVHRRKKRAHIVSAHVSEKILQHGFVARPYGAQRDRRTVERRAGAVTV
jgi:hypothetical protein